MKTTGGKRTGAARRCTRRRIVYGDQVGRQRAVVLCERRLQIGGRSARRNVVAARAGLSRGERRIRPHGALAHARAQMQHNRVLPFWDGMGKRGKKLRIRTRSSCLQTDRRTRSPRARAGATIARFSGQPPKTNLRN